ncbi:hypothetical protein D3C85_1372330 [compost metagenome]
MNEITDVSTCLQFIIGKEGLLVRALEDRLALIIVNNKVIKHALMERFVHFLSIEKNNHVEIRMIIVAEYNWNELT